MSSKTDALIVGGGIAGLALAYELVQAGKSVRVIDRQKVGKAASWAAAGILPATCRGGQEHDDYERLRTLSWTLFPDWVAKIHRDSGVDPEFERAGGVHIATSRGEFVALKVAAAQWKSDGLLVDPLETVVDWTNCEPALVPAVERRLIQGGFWMPDECMVRPPRLLQALAAAIRKQHVVMEEDVTIVEWQGDSERLKKVVTTAGEFVADQYCIASGAWSAMLGEELGLDLEVEPWRGQMVMFRAPPKLIRAVINEGPNYLVPRRDGRILAGSTVEEVGFDDSNSQEAIDQLIRFAESLLPELNHTNVEATWAGLRPGSGDGMPLIGRSCAFVNLFLSTRHFRSGIFLAPASALLLRQLMLEESLTLDLGTFNPNRK